MEGWENKILKFNRNIKEGKIHSPPTIPQTQTILIPFPYNMLVVQKGVGKHTFHWTLRRHGIAVKEIDLLYILDLWRQSRTRTGR